MQSSKSKWFFWFSAVVFLLVAAKFVLLNLTKLREPEMANVCINHLRAIEAAKIQWAETHRATNGTLVPETDVFSLLADSRMRHCPLQGIYRVNQVGSAPTCSMSTLTPSHVLP